jgi:CBS domain-containing protein
MNVEEIMSRDQVTIELPANRSEVLQLMVTKDVSCVYVAGRDMTLKGIVTRKDILRNRDKDQVALIMRRDPIRITIGSDIKEAAKLMYEHRIHNLPVVDENGIFAGAIRTSEFLRIVEEGEYKEQVGSVMGRCIPVYEETPLSVIREIMEIADSYALCVLDGEGKLTGVITEADLFKHIRIDESINRIDLGLGEDEDKWTWEGMRDIVGLYYVNAMLSLPAIPVKEAMIREVITASPKTSISTAARKMRVNNLEQLPVVSVEGNLLGMVDDIDLLKVL